MNSELDKIKNIEADLKKSLKQAQGFNENLQKLLAVKVEEQKTKDTQCRQIQSNLLDLNSQLSDFQTQFLGINDSLKYSYYL